jgi:hypothetical protein
MAEAESSYVSVLFCPDCKETLDLDPPESPPTPANSRQTAPSGKDLALLQSISGITLLVAKITFDNMPTRDS